MFSMYVPLIEVKRCVGVYEECYFSAIDAKKGKAKAQTRQMKVGIERASAWIFL